MCGRVWSGEVGYGQLGSVGVGWADTNTPVAALWLPCSLETQEEARPRQQLYGTRTWAWTWTWWVANLRQQLFVLCGEGVEPTRAERQQKWHGERIATQRAVNLLTLGLTCGVGSG